MFTIPAIEKNVTLSNIVDRLMGDRDMAQLRDNNVRVGIFLQINDKPTLSPGRIQLSTELEKLYGYDAVIYINSEWYTYAKEIDTEAAIYQMLLTIYPTFVGKANIPIMKIDKDKGVIVCPQTVERYGHDINWYKELFKNKTRW